MLELQLLVQEIQEVRKCAFGSPLLDTLFGNPGVAAGAFKFQLVDDLGPRCPRSSIRSWNSKKTDIILRLHYLWSGLVRSQKVQEQYVNNNGVGVELCTSSGGSL